MLELAKEHNATILQASTSEVYGDPLVHPQNEEYRGNVNPIEFALVMMKGKDVLKAYFLIIIDMKALILK